MLGNQVTNGFRAATLILSLLLIPEVSFSQGLERGKEALAELGMAGSSR